MATTWGYGHSDGPDTWSTKFPAACGQRQSPIDIDTSKVLFQSVLSEHPLRISYQRETNLSLSNTGASVKADCGQDSTLSGGPLGNDVYRLAQFHLHWGSKDDRGAEHTIDGKVYSAELHLVHWNSTRYSSFEEAANKIDGLAVLCIFIKVGKTHKGFDTLSSQLENAICKGDCFKLRVSFDPMCLLPSNTKRFWTYPGSLTTPPCYESVQFILFEEVVEFSPEQMQALRSLKVGDVCSECMADNFRPTCSLGSRVVLASFIKNKEIYPFVFQSCALVFLGFMLSVTFRFIRDL